MARVAAIRGPSNSGKTTLLAAAIAELVASGHSVAAIKHTHHEINDDDRGDTARFRSAGADPVILAGNAGEAVVFSGASKRRISYQSPSDLLQDLNTDAVLVEGFSSFDGWPSLELRSGEWRSTAEVMTILDRMETP